MLPLRLATYELTLAAAEPVLLREPAGAALRGAFGQQLKRFSCVEREGCPPCRHPDVCAYGRIFEPKAVAGLHGVQPGAEAARPFVFEPPPAGTYQPGEAIRFGLHLFGQAIDFLPYFLLAFRELTRHGLGPGRGRVELDEVWAVDGLHGRKERVYSAREELIRSVDLSLPAEALGGMENGKWKMENGTEPLFPSPLSPSPALPCSPSPALPCSVRLRLLTPTRLTHHSNLLREPLFAPLFARLLDRIEVLCLLYGGGPPDHDARALNRAAREVELVEHDTEWIDWKRYSRRQQQEIPLGGLVGTATYRGDLLPFLPYLRLGEYVHVGKGCVYGLGKIRVDFFNEF